MILPFWCEKTILNCELKDFVGSHGQRKVAIEPNFKTNEARNFKVYCHVFLTIYFEIKVKDHFRHLSIGLGAENGL